jgi:mannose-1-phosphate guanylyltransferase
MGDLKGVIMAGGEGKRFRPLTYYLQKCMIPVGDKEKPILEYIIRLFSYHKITDLVLLVGYKYKQIENYFNSGDRFNVKIRYILDHPKIKGSAYAIINAYNEGILSEDDTIIVYYGDIVSNINLIEMVEHHRKTGAIATVALAPGFTVRVGTAEVDGDFVESFIEKPTLDTPVSMGVLVLDGSIISVMNEIYSEGNYASFDLMGDIIQNLVKRGEKIGAYLTKASWYDIGSIERYERLKGDKLSNDMEFVL